MEFHQNSYVAKGSVLQMKKIVLFSAGSKTGTAEKTALIHSPLSVLLLPRSVRAC